MKILCSALIVILSLSSHAQQDSGDEYRIASLIIDSLATALDFQYFHPDVPVNEALDDYILYPDSIFSRIDRKTSWKVSKPGHEWHSLLTDQFIAHEERHRLRLEGHNDVILISTFNEINWTESMKTDLRFADALNESGINASLLQPFKWDVNRIVTSHPITFQKFHSANMEQYQYVITASMNLSNVVYNRRRDNALLQLVYQHRTATGITGSDMLILFAKQNGEWKISKMMRLWEE